MGFICVIVFPSVWYRCVKSVEKYYCVFFRCINGWLRVLSLWRCVFSMRWWWHHQESWWLCTSVSWCDTNFSVCVCVCTGCDITILYYIINISAVFSTYLVCIMWILTYCSCQNVQFMCSDVVYPTMQCSQIDLWWIIQDWDHH